jgi:diaminopimelate decarboxylase
VLDLGGSLACPTVAPLPNRQFRLNRALGSDLLPPDPAAVLRIGDAAVLAVTQVTDHARSAGIPAPRVVLEPGRALTGDTQLLLTSVVDVKDDTVLVHAVLDAGMNIAEPVPHEYHQLFSVTAPGAAATTAYRLAGPICTPADVPYNNWRLPPLAPGHVLAIMDTGAYFVPFSTTFSFPKPAIVVRDGDTVTVARRRETWDDMVALDDDTDLTDLQDVGDPGHAGR